MSRALMTCQKCGARKFESEVFYDRKLKDFICRDESLCSKAGKQIGKKRKVQTEVKKKIN